MILQTPGNANCYSTQVPVLSYTDKNAGGRQSQDAEGAAVYIILQAPGNANCYSTQVPVLSYTDKNVGGRQSQGAGGAAVYMILQAPGNAESAALRHFYQE